MRKIDTFDDVKRIIFFCSYITAITYLILNRVLADESFQRVIIGYLLLIYFSVSLFFLVKKLLLRLIEYVTLILINTYLIIKIYQSVQTNLLTLGIDWIGDYILWMPIIVFTNYLVLSKKKGLFFSLFVFILTVIIGMPYFEQFTSNQKDSIIRYYTAHLIYIIVFYIFQRIFNLYTEMKVLQNNAYIDSLTAIPNRRRIGMHFEHAIENAYSGRGEFSIIIIDIDNFKKINDQFGHNVGDDVLREFALLINDNLSRHDYFGRWGGEEFLIVTPNPLNDAEQLAEKLRLCIERHYFKPLKQVTSSFGVASYKKDDNLENLLKRADNALYISKNNGRNQVSVERSK